MTNIEQKALVLLNEVCAEMGLEKVRSLELDMPGERALLHAIKQHEAFRQEVSDALREWYDGTYPQPLERFIIIAKPDPLVDAMNESLDRLGAFDAEEADNLRAAIEARGGRIVWEGE